MGELVGDLVGPGVDVVPVAEVTGRSVDRGGDETFAEAGRQHFGGDTRGKWIVTSGLGGMGGAQPLAATMAGFSILCIECDESRIDFRLRTRYLDVRADNLDHALELITDACNSGKALSVGLLGNGAEVLPELVKRGGLTWSRTRLRPMIRSMATCLPAGAWNKRN